MKSWNRNFWICNQVKGKLVVFFLFRNLIQNILICLPLSVRGLGIYRSLIQLGNYFSFLSGLVYNLLGIRDRRYFLGWIFGRRARSPDCYAKKNVNIDLSNPTSRYLTHLSKHSIQCFALIEEALER